MSTDGISISGKQFGGGVVIANGTRTVVRSVELLGVLDGLCCSFNKATNNQGSVLIMIGPGCSGQCIRVVQLLAFSVVVSRRGDD
jgi:uncharacterized membrane protein